MIKVLFLLTISSLFSQYNYNLEDINSNSSNYGQIISPATFNNQVTLHFFGHQN